MLRSWRAAFLFFTRFPAAWGQQRERHRLTSPGYFVFLCPPPIRAPTAKHGREPLARASTRSTVHRKEWSNKRLLLQFRSDGKTASHNGSREIIASHRGQPAPPRQRPLFSALAPPSNVEGGHGRTRRPGPRGVLRDAGAEIFHMQVRPSPVTSIHVGAHHCRRLLLEDCGHSAGHGDDGRRTIRCFTCGWTRGVDATLARGSLLVGRLRWRPFFDCFITTRPRTGSPLAATGTPAIGDWKKQNDMAAARSNWLDRPAPASNDRAKTTSARSHSPRAIKRHVRWKR